MERYGDERYYKKVVDIGHRDSWASSVAIIFRWLLELAHDVWLV